MGGGFKILPTTEPRQFQKDVVSSRQINIQFQSLLTGISVWTFWAKGHDEAPLFSLCAVLWLLWYNPYILFYVTCGLSDVTFCVVFLETMREWIIACSPFLACFLLTWVTQEVELEWSSRTWFWLGCWWLEVGTSFSTLPPKIPG